VVVALEVLMLRSSLHLKPSRKTSNLAAASAMQPCLHASSPTRDGCWFVLNCYTSHVHQLPGDTSMVLQVTRQSAPKPSAPPVSSCPSNCEAACDARRTSRVTRHTSHTTTQHRQPPLLGPRPRRGRNFMQLGPASSINDVSLWCFLSSHSTMPAANRLPGIATTGVNAILKSCSRYLTALR
jgi:hypothetical protein